MKTTRCEHCKRSPSEFEGCARIVCPKRKRYTATPPGAYAFEQPEREMSIAGGYIRLPANKDKE
jgi:hypothetical protein